MVHVVCPKCQNRDMKQDPTNPTFFTCSRCGRFILLPAEPSSEDILAIWDYLIQSGKHVKKLESMLKNWSKLKSS